MFARNKHLLLWLPWFKDLQALASVGPSGCWRHFRHQRRLDIFETHFSSLTSKPAIWSKQSEVMAVKDQVFVLRKFLRCALCLGQWQQSHPEAGKLKKKSTRSHRRSSYIWETVFFVSRLWSHWWFWFSCIEIYSINILHRLYITHIYITSLTVLFLCPYTTYKSLINSATLK